MLRPFKINLNPIHLTLLIFGLLLPFFVGIVVIKAQQLTPPCTYDNPGSIFPIFNRCANVGYFDRKANQSTTTTTSVLPGGIEVNNIDAFVSAIKGHLNATGTNAEHRRNGAIFLIRIMLQHVPATNGTMPKTITEAMVDDWEKRVRAYSALGKITWNSSENFTVNSAYNTATKDFHWFPSNQTGRPSIVFRHLTSNEVILRIKRDCANPVGTTAGVPDLPKYTYSANNVTGSPAIGTSTTPVNVEKGTKVRINGTVTSSGTGSGAGANYHFQIRPIQNSAYVSNAGTSSGGSFSGKDAVWSNLGGLTVNTTSGIRWAEYTVNSSAIVNNLVCFSSRVQPREGYTGTSVIIDNNWHDSTDRCYRVVDTSTHWNYRPNTLSSSTSTTSPKAPGESITIDASVTNIGTGAGPSYTLEIISTLNGNYVTAPGQTSCNQNGLDAGVTGPICSASFTVNDNAPDGAQVCFNSRVSPVTGQSTPSLTNPNPSASTTGTQLCYTISAPEQPYLEVYGADVWAGGVLATETPLSCTNTSAGNNKQIKSNFSASNPLKGSFGQFGVYATGPIVGFGSRGSTTNPNLPDLTFANTGQTRGNFKDEGVCMTNFYSLLIGNTPTTSSTFPPSSGQYQYTASSIGTQTLSSGQKLILLIEGNVNITGNIQYPNNYSATNPSQIPLLMIVATGDINIRSTVTQLDGIYISHKNINTCTLTNDLPPTTTIIGSACDNSKLLINGLFTADKVNFDRTNGGIKRGGPSEEFRFSPETYLGLPNFISDYITTMSAQQFKDLPPVY